MGRFLTFETTALKLNDSVFPCNSVSFSLNANTIPVFDINGNLLYYSPTAPIQGKFQTQFYLTGALPNFLKLENQSEVPVDVKFNQFYIPSAFLTNLNFSVDPFQPILVNVDFVFYHGLLALDTNLSDQYRNFSNSLATLNGLGSYVITDNRSTYIETAGDFLVTNFNYSFSVEREPVIRIKQSVPSRVAIKQINAEFNVGANNLDGLLQVQGNVGLFSGVLRDNENLSTSTNFTVSGIIVDQSYSVSEGNYGVSNIKMIQSINPRRSILTIPYEVEDYNISIPELTIDDPVLKPRIVFDPNVLCPIKPPIDPNPPGDINSFYAKIYLRNAYKTDIYNEQNEVITKLSSVTALSANGYNKEKTIYNVDYNKENPIYASTKSLPSADGIDENDPQRNTKLYALWNDDALKQFVDCNIQDLTTYTLVDDSANRILFQYTFNIYSSSQEKDLTYDQKKVFYSFIIDRLGYLIAGGTDYFGCIQKDITNIGSSTNPYKMMFTINSSNGDGNLQ